MPWQTPKTDWTKKDVATPSDLNRIEANILELKKASTIDIEDSAGNFEATNVEDALQELAGNVTMGKTVVASAISSMGQQADGSMTFAELAAKIRDISKDATAAPNDVLSGRTFYQGGLKRTGTMPNRGAVVITPGPTTKPIPAGYHNGEGYVATDPNLVPENIAQGKSIFGVEGSLLVNPFEKYNRMKVLQVITSFTQTEAYYNSVSPDGTYVVIWGYNTTAFKVYKRSGDTWSLVYQGTFDNNTNQICWTSDGLYFVAAQQNGYVQLFKRLGDSFSSVSSIRPASAHVTNLSGWDATDTYFVCYTNGLRLIKRTGDALSVVSVISSFSGYSWASSNHCIRGDSNLQYMVIVVMDSSDRRYMAVVTRSGDSLSLGTFAISATTNPSVAWMTRSGNYVLVLREGRQQVPEVALYKRSGTTLTLVKNYGQFTNTLHTVLQSFQSPYTGTPEDADVFPILLTKNVDENTPTCSGFLVLGIDESLEKIRYVTNFEGGLPWGMPVQLNRVIDGLSVSYSRNGDVLVFISSSNYSQNTITFVQVGELP